MSTLTSLKARIADDLARSDLSSQIANAITDAITHYQPSRFYFTESRDATFATVADQSRYSSSDDADIPKFIKFDAVFLADSLDIVYELEMRPPVEMENLLDGGAPSGRPHSYAYFANGFQLFPIPDAVYTIRPVGVIRKDAPTTDGEADNVWMTEAYELLRCRAKLYLAVHVLRNTEMALTMKAAETEALSKIRSETTKKASGGRVLATAF